MSAILSNNLRVKKGSTFIQHVYHLSFATVFYFATYFSISNHPHFHASNTVIQLSKGGVVKMQMYDLKTVLNTASLKPEEKRLLFNSPPKYFLFTKKYWNQTFILLTIKTTKFTASKKNSLVVTALSIRNKNHLQHFYR